MAYLNEDGLETLVGKIKGQVVELTSAEYEQLPESKNTDNKLYFVKDGAYTMGTIYRNGIPYVGGDSGSKVSSVNTVTPDTNGNVQIDATDIDTFSGVASKSASGNPVTITDALQGKALGVNATLDPIQDLHGYDHPWAGGAGKNLLPLTLDAIKAANTFGTWSDNVWTSSGISFTVNTDESGNVASITANGSNSETDVVINISANGISGDYYFNCLINNIPSGTTVSADAYAWDTTTVARIKQWNGTTNSETDKIGRLRQIQPVEGHNNVIRLRIYKNYVANNVVFYPMICESSETDPTFEPYSNICPISGRTSVDVTRTGKNLCSNASDIHLLMSTSGVVDTNARCDLYYFPTSLGTVTISIDDLTSVSDSTIRTGYVDEIPEAGTVGVRANNMQVNHKTYVLDTNHKYFVIMLLWRSTSAKTNIQVEVGSSATSYEEYKGQSATVQLGQTVYGGTLNVTTGELTVDKAMADLGSLNWLVHGTYASTFYADVSGKQPRSTKFISSAYANGGLFSNYASIENGMMYASTSDALPRIAVKNTTYTTASDFKTAMSGQTVVYELATPQTIRLTPAQLNLLTGTNVISTNADDLSVRYYASGANVEESIAYLSNKIAALDASKTDYFTIAEGTDLNTILKSGVYRSPNTNPRVSTLVNCPISTPFTMLVTGSGISTAGCIQSIFGENQIYIRRGASDGLRSWVLFVSINDLTVQFPSTGWTTTETVNGTTYYTQTVRVEYVIEKPIIAISPITGTLPTSAEQSAFNSVDYFTADNTARTIKAYATSAPSDTFAVVVKGAL